jgi:uncharacterized membrane protein
MPDNFIVYRKKYKNLQDEKYKITTQENKKEFNFHQFGFANKPNENKIEISGLPIFFMIIGITLVTMGLITTSLTITFRCIIVSVGLFLDMAVLSYLLYPK